MKEKWKNFFDNVWPYLDILGDIADIVVHVSSKPTYKDWVAIGLASGRVASKIVQKRQSEMSNQFADYFENNGIEYWYIGEGLKHFLLELADKIEVLEKAAHDQIISVNFGEEKIFIHISSLTGNKSQTPNEGEKANDDVMNRNFLCREMWGTKSDRIKELFATIRSKLWKEGKYILIDKRNGISQKQFRNFPNHIKTDFIQNFMDKIDLAKKHNFLGRGFLIEGLPGTGKTNAVDYIVAHFKHKTIRINLDFLDDNRWNDTRPEMNISFADVLQLVEISQAEFIIFDDLDYIHSWNQNKLLSFFEELNLSQSIVVATVNNHENLLPALQRPARLDERIEVNGLDRKILEQILDEEDQELIEEFADVPIAFINEFKKRKVMYSREEGLDFIREYKEEREKSSPTPAEDDENDDEEKYLEQRDKMMGD